MSLTDHKITGFISATASGEPVPGGGSISALCGALSAALGEMVARLTIGKKKYADAEEQMQHIIKNIAPISKHLAEAVNLDSDAYDQVMQAYKLPKDTDEQKDRRNISIQTALKHAASVPFTVAETTASILPMLEELATKGNQNAITDAYVATLCARTAILGACANTKINLLSIHDQKFVSELGKKVLLLEREANEAEKRVTIIVNKSFE